MSTPRTIIRRLLDEATATALHEVELRARKILAGSNRARSFCMAMGGASFYDKDGTPMSPDLHYLKGFYTFLEEFDDQLKLTGIPLKLQDAKGPVITDW